ncbi:hypothetical protein ASPFODRAFT_617827 [Aspergillus luchuensis CBS 106.47]|uniref:Uncharacterized protein n=1 Tax=Aspergillus luchuensis (strain CBS 106.47) TaxID=1137211 RepID=A0A1M3TJV5_ASPLC|nr:hypothetical protein ASPFODRAFT_617827 [Aspergillus luchuensis CBS 106.47]
MADGWIIVWGWPFRMGNVSAPPGTGGSTCRLRKGVILSFHLLSIFIPFSFLSLHACRHSQVTFQECNVLFTSCKQGQSN